MRRHLLLLLAGTVLLAACGATQGSAGGAEAPPAARSQAAYGTNQTAGSAGASTAKAARGAAAPPAAAPVPPLPSSQHLELNATVGLQVPHNRFETGLDSILGIVASERGYLSSSHTATTGGELRSGTFTFQVPVDNYQDMLNQLRTVGTFTHQDSTSKPHDAEYVDLQARLQSSQLQLAAFNALLPRATSISDIIAIEQQVAQVQQQIEEYQGQLQYLDSLTQYSTITVDLAEKGAAPGPSPLPDQWGFTSSLRAVVHNLAAIADGIILVGGTLLPFLLLALLAFLTRRRWMPVLVRT
jgi:hypothetical protein